MVRKGGSNSARDRRPWTAPLGGWLEAASVHRLAPTRGRGRRPPSTPTGRTPQDPESGVKPINHNNLQHIINHNNKKRMYLRAVQIASECGALLSNIGVC